MTYKRANTDWLANCRYGISFHWTALTMPRQGAHRKFQDAVDRFRLDDFLGSTKDSGADYVIFTSTHAKQVLPCPNEAMDAIIKGHTCERDLIAEMADGLGKMGKDLIIYYNHGCNNGDDLEWKSAVGYGDVDKEPFVKNLCDVVSCMGRRYGKSLKAFWFDSGYSLDPKGPHNTVTTDMSNFQFPWERWTAAAKDGHPERLVTHNAGVMQYYLYTDCQDYWAGEMVDLLNPPTSRYADNGLQWNGWTCIDDRSWVWTDTTNPEPEPLYSDDELLAFLLKCRAHQGPMCFNVAISQEGIVSSAAVSALRRLGAGLERRGFGATRKQTEA